MSLIGDILNNVGNFFSGGNKKPATTTTTTRAPQTVQRAPRTIGDPLNVFTPANTLQKPKPTTTTTTTVAPKKNEKPLIDINAKGDQEVFTGKGPASAVGNFAVDSLAGLGSGIINTARTVGDVVANGVAHATNNKAGIAQFNKATAEDYNGSLIKPVAKTVKLIPDAVSELTKPGNTISKGTEDDLNESLFAPLVGVRNQSVQDAAQRFITSNNANNDAKKANDDLAALQKKKAELDAQGIVDTSLDSTITAATADAKKKNAARDVAVKDFSALQPGVVASNAANSVLAVEGGVKTARELVPRKAGVGEVAAPASKTNTAPTVANDVAPGVSSVNTDAPKVASNGAPAVTVPRDAQGNVIVPARSANVAPVSTVAATVDPVTAPVRPSVPFLDAAPKTIGQAERQFARQGSVNLPDSTFDADARAATVMPDVSDVPAILRRSDRYPGDADKQARLSDLNTIIEGAPDASHLRAAEFQLKQNFADQLRARPDLEPQLKKELARQQKQLKADSAAVDAALTERDTLVQELSDNQQAQRRAKSVGELRRAYAEAPEPTPAPAPAPAAEPAVSPVTTARAPEIPSFTDEPARPVATASTRAPKKAPQSALPNANVGGSAKTGETGKSTGKFSRGQEYEKTSREAGRARGEAEATNTSFDEFTKKIDSAQGMTGADRDTATALQSRYKVGSPEHRRLGDLINKYNTEAGQALGTIEKVVRKTAEPKQLTDRFANKVYANMGEDANISDAAFDGVVKKNEEFTSARDNYNKALDDFNNDPSDANTDAFVKARAAMEAADQAAKFEEYKVASGIKSKNPKREKFVQKLEEDAGVYTMDAVDSSLLSSTRVMFNNFVNTGLGRAEEQIFGKAGAAIARKLTGTNIGGGSFRGGRLGARLGDQKLAADVRARAGANGNALVKGYKNVVTTGNTLGERNTSAAAYSGIYDYYRNSLKEQGYKGAELERRSVVSSLDDPNNIADIYAGQARATNGMSSITTGQGRIRLEKWIKDSIAEKLGGSKPAKFVGSAATRLLVGFPSVIARSAIAGGKRTLLGGPSLMQGIVNAARKGDPAVTALHFKNAVKEGGSGALMIGAGAALGSMGVITGSYPTDPEEREQWQREGKSEHSIKIGDSYYSLPSALGVFALPFMIGANGGSNVSEGKSATDNFGQSTLSTLIDSMPTETLGNSLDFLNDLASGKDVSKFGAQTGAGFAKTLTPASGLLGELAKMFDPTVNDTTKGDVMAQLMAKIANGLPGVANGLPDKKVDGQSINNPNPLELFFGAQSTDQSAGQAKTAELAAARTSQNARLNEIGALSDSVRGILDKDNQAVFDKVKSGEDVTDKELADLRKSIGKSATKDGDTRFLEDGNYDGNLAVLQAKRDALEEDPTSTKKERAAYDKQIARGKVFKDNQTPYELTELYDKTSLSEWRNMGDPDKDEYDPETYQKLYDLDSKLAAAGGADGKEDPKTNKYTAKKESSKSGKGGSSKAARAEASLIKSNTIGSTPDIKSLTLGDLAPKKITDQAATVPVLQKIKSTDLVKKRTISVSKA